MKIKMSEGPWTVWDNGFSYIVAPSEVPATHPHPHVALHQNSIKEFSTASTKTSKELKALLKKAWDYANVLNVEAVKGA